MGFISENPDKDWNWTNLSSNPSITWEIVKQNPDKNWDWEYLCKNVNITWEIISDNLDKKLNWVNLSSNPNITWKIVLDNVDKPWEFNLLSDNKMYRHDHFCSDNYRKRQLKQFWEKSMEEFIAKSWHPDRVDSGWCLDEDEKKERLEFYGI